MWVLHTITTPRAVGFGLALASAGLLIIACTDRGTPVEPSAVSLPEAGAATRVGPEGSHSHHSAMTGLEDELAQVRQMTAQFHRLEAAADAGYKLGYVNGSSSGRGTGAAVPGI